MTGPGVACRAAQLPAVRTFIPPIEVTSSCQRALRTVSACCMQRRVIEAPRREQQRQRDVGVGVGRRVVVGDAAVAPQRCEWRAAAHLEMARRPAPHRLERDPVAHPHGAQQRVALALRRGDAAARGVDDPSVGLDERPAGTPTMPRRARCGGGSPHGLAPPLGPGTAPPHAASTSVPARAAEATLCVRAFSPG